MPVKIVLPLLMMLVFAGAIVIPRLIQPGEEEEAPPSTGPVLMPTASPTPETVFPALTTITPAEPMHSLAATPTPPDPNLLDPFFRHLAESDHDQAQVYLESVAAKLPETTRANLSSALAAAKREKQEFLSTLKETQDLIKEMKGTATQPAAKGPFPKTVSASFASDSSMVSEADKAILSSVAKTLAERTDLSVELRGFADTSGDPRYNAILASARAEAVRDVLVLKEVEVGRIRVLPFGESQTSPKADPATARRVDVVFR